MGALFSNFFAEHTPTLLTTQSNFCCLEAITSYYLVVRVSVFWWLKSSASCPLPSISDIAICVLVKEPRTSTRAQGRTRFRTVCVEMGIGGVDTGCRKGQWRDLLGP